MPAVARTTAPATRAARGGAAPARGARARRTATPAMAMAAPAPATISVGPGAARAERQRAVIARLGGATRNMQGPAVNAATARTAASGNAANASSSAPVPENEPLATGQGERVEAMGREQRGQVRQQTFLEVVEEALGRVPTPQTPEQMEQFRGQQGGSGLRQQVQGPAMAEARQAGESISTASSTPATPVPSPTPTALTPQAAAPRTSTVQARQGLPTPRTEQEVSLEPSRQQVNDELAQERITDERLQEANDPRFTATRDQRDRVIQNVEAAPGQYRQAETRELNHATRDVERAETAQLGSMRGQRNAANAGVSGRQRAQMAQEARDRRWVAEQIERRFNETRDAVTQKLEWLEQQVDRRFTTIENRAKTRFESFVDDSMSSWKLRRYGRRALIPVVGLFVAAGTWAYDKLRGIDHFPEIRQIFVDGKELYKSIMREGIREISDLVEQNLSWCQTRIQQGRDSVRDFVRGLRTDLQSVGQEAARNMEDRFSELRDTVNDRRNQLANRLVDRYRQSMQALDQRIEEMRAANRGLVARFVGFVREVIRAIREFRTRLMSLLAEVRDVVERIVEHPIRFLGNLVRALRQGFEQFKNNIVTHLRSALVGWLFGTLAQAGIRVPTEFSLRSIVGFILEILGITYPRIRQKVVRIIGERNMALIERAWEYISILIREGPIGLWNHIREELSSLWDTALGMIRDYVTAQIVRAAVTRLATLFNPLGAIVQAVLGIYNAVMFFVERINQIMEFVRTVVRSLDRIERGDIGAAANWIERAMAQGLTLIISFLARFLGLGGIGDAIRGFVQRIQDRVDRVIDRALERIVAGFRAAFARLRGATAEPAGTVTRPFTANSASHRIRASVTGNRLRLQMASGEFSDLRAKLESYPPVWMGSADSEVRARAARLQSRLHAVEQREVVLAQDYQRATGAAKETLLADGVKEIVDTLVAISGEFGITYDERVTPARPVSFTNEPLDEAGRAGGGIVPRLTFLALRTATGANRRETPGYGLTPMVGAHLIPDKWGGPATAQNLAAATNAANQQCTNVETLVGNALKGGNRNNVLPSALDAVRYESRMQWKPLADAGRDFATWMGLGGQAEGEKAFKDTRGTFDLPLVARAFRVQTRLLDPERVRIRRAYAHNYVNGTFTITVTPLGGSVPPHQAVFTTGRLVNSEGRMHQSDLKDGRDGVAARWPFEPGPPR